MVCEPNPGVLDFQDAVFGPITYDMVSLVRDAFVAGKKSACSTGSCATGRRRDGWLPVDADFGEFWRALEWMGLQRHLKVLGIFAHQLPRRQAAVPPGHAALHRLRALGLARYRELAPLARLLDELE